MLIDSVFCDYGGVVADHYSEPYLGQLAQALGTTRETARALVSERSPHGRLYRLDQITKAEFWNAVRQLAPRKDFDDEVVQDLWAQTYIPNRALLSLLRYLRDDLGIQTGIVMNEDRWRFRYIEEHFDLRTYVDHVIASFEVGAIKPDSEMYSVILRRALRTDRPGLLLYIDDRESHVEAAKKQGIEGYCYRNSGELSVYIGHLLETGQLRGRLNI